MNTTRQQPDSTFAERATAYYLQLSAPTDLPSEVEVMNPYGTEAVQTVVRTFYQRYFQDHQLRTFILGINPGRFGGGITGISFTDPIALQQHCHISHPFPLKAELSSRFVYQVIDRLGGPAAFYSQFYLSSLYPLALIKHGKNYNFYDEPLLYSTLKPAIVANLWAQIGLGAHRTRVICMGRKNADYLHRLNDEYGFFDSIFVVEHPRYVMQYKLKQLDYYLEKYVSALQEKA